MDLGNSDLNPSSIIDLKAELHKKYESFRKAKLDQSTVLTKPTPFKNKSDTTKDKKQKPVPIVRQKDTNYEEDLALKKSRLALEAKAKLYEKIISNQILIDDEQNDSYQVDFQRKVLYNTPEPEKNTSVDNNTAEFINSSKYNPATSLDYSIYQPRVLDPPVSSQKLNSEKSGISDTDQPTHYQNVQYSEVRDHGTGYFAFSMDETKRKEQMDELNQLRQETEEQRTARQRQQNKRKAMLQARLAKICERKNIDQSVLDVYKATTETENKDVSHAQSTDLSSIPLPEPEPEIAKKKPKVRPWDIGKDNLQHFVPEKKQKIRSQNDWVEERRQERQSEFAPPSLYISNI